MKKNIGLKNSGLFYFLICMIFNAWCIQKGSERIDLIDIPHIVIGFSPVWFAMILGIALLLLLLASHQIKGDLIVCLLFLRLLLPLIPALYCGEQKDFLGNYSIVIMCLISYLIAYNAVEDTDKLHRIILVIFFMISIQTVCESLLGTNTFWDDTYYYKNDLTIPIGSSNAIGSKIVPCFAFLFCTSDNKIEKILLTITAFFISGLTKSRSTVIVCLIIFGLVSIWTSKLTLKKIIQYVVLLLILGVGFLYFTQDTKIGGFVFDANLSTVFNRENLIEKGIQIFWKNPIVGKGFSKDVIMGNPHNLLVFILMRSGIVGMILFIVIAITILFKFHNYLSDPIVKGCFCFMLCMLFQSMAEIVLLSYICDFLFWFIAGTASNRIRQYSD